MTLLLLVGSSLWPHLLPGEVGFFQHNKTRHFQRFSWESEWHFLGMTPLSFQAPSPSIPPWKKSSCAFSRARFKAAAQSFTPCLHSPIQYQATSVCVPSCSPLVHCMWGSTWPWAHGCGGNTGRSKARGTREQAPLSGVLCIPKCLWAHSGSTHLAN